MSKSLPPNWKACKFSDIAQINPRRPSELNELPADYPVTFVPMSSVSEKSGSIEEGIERPLSEVKKGFTYFAENDVIFAKITPCMQNGKSAIARNLINGLGFGSTEFHVIRPTADALPEWIYYFVRQQSFLDEAKSHFRGSAGQQRVSAEFVSDHKIPLPPLKEQYHIVNRIKEYLSRVNEIKQLRQETRQEAGAIFPSLLSSVFDDVQEQVIPTTIGDVVLETRFGTSNKCHSAPVGVPILRIPNVANGGVNLDDLKYCQLTSAEEDKLLLHPGDILVVRTNGSPDLVGRCAVVNFNEAEKFGFASYLIRIRVNQSKVNPNFLSYFLTSSHGRKAIAAIRRTAAGQYNVNSENLRAITFPLPDRKLQDELVDRMNEQREACEVMKAEQAEQAKSESHLAASILAKAFAGEL